MAKQNAYLQEQLALYEQGNLALQRELEVAHQKLATVHEQLAFQKELEVSTLKLQVKKELEMALLRVTALEDQLYERQVKIASLHKQLGEEQQQNKLLQRENIFLRSLVTEYYQRNPQAQKKI